MKYFLSFLCLFYTVSSSAGIFLEPYVGYLSAKHTGKWDNYVDKLDLPSDSASGAAFGARAGYGIGPLGLALDFMTTGTLKEENNFESKMTNIGATVMLGLPIVRFWAGYIFSSQLKLETDDLSGTEKGSGFKVGAGWSIFPLLSLNLEYLMLNYDSMSYDDFQDTTRKTNAILLSVSVPIVF